MIGFTAIDLTVSCMTEVMWMFVLLDNSLLGMVFDYTLKFILSPVRLQKRLSMHYCLPMTLLCSYYVRIYVCVVY